MPLHIPTMIVPATTSEPRNLLIYSQPKVGKTQTVAALGASLAGLLHIDTEDGTAFVATRRVHVRTRAEWEELKTALPAAWKASPFRFLVIDSIDRVEEWALEAANERYRTLPMGKTFGGSSVLELALGAGFGLQRDAFDLLLRHVVGNQMWNTIFIAHARAKYIDNVATDAEADEVDLTGKIRKLMCRKCDGIGRVARDREGKLTISFKTKDQQNCGVRALYLRDKTLSFPFPPTAEAWAQIWPESWNKPCDVASVFPPAPVAVKPAVPAVAPPRQPPTPLLPAPVATAPAQ